MQTRTPVDQRTMPILIEPQGRLEGSAVALCSWAAEHRQELDAWLNRFGAVLLRGFCIGSPGEFHDVVTAIRPQLLSYVGGDSPRTALGERIYTSTDFPPDMEIGLHNELSYTRSWPERVFFCCLAAAESGGETHIADSRKVFAQMDPAVRDRFSDKGVIYRQHLRDGNGAPGPGKSWQETFDTTDPAETERICSDQHMDFQWTNRGLRTSLRNPGVLSHPVTAQTCWFNQADMWHASFDSVKAQESAGATEGPVEEMLGSHACYGDGSDIPIADLEAVRSACRKSEVLFPWRAGPLKPIKEKWARHRAFRGQTRVIKAGKIR